MHDELIAEIKRKLDFIQDTEPTALLDILTYNTLVGIDIMLENWHETAQDSEEWLFHAVSGALHSEN
jgi:hypothetical protein